MKILIVENAEIATEKAAKILKDVVANSPNPVLGLATGGTMLNVYKHLVKQYEQGGFSFSNTSTFNLDEYIGLKEQDPSSYRSYMNKNLFDYIDIKITNTHLPNGTSTDLYEEAISYEKKINELNGMDVLLLGLGKNGHIGFNEPSSSLGSYTRIKRLSQDTCKANKKYFTGNNKMPTHAITMGIQTILDARHCVLVATGTEKSSAVRDMIEGAIASRCPASALQLHRNATVIIDKKAASTLSYIDDYLYIHPDGDDVLLSH